MLSLGHATKAGEGRYPFGSIFWHNLARITWSVAHAGGEGHRIILQSRKHNNYPALGKHLVTVAWSDGRPTGFRFEGYTASLSEDITSVLGSETITVTEEFVDRLNEDREDGVAAVKADSVRAALRRGAKTKAFNLNGTKWQVAA